MEFTGKCLLRQHDLKHLRRIIRRRRTQCYQSLLFVWFNVNTGIFHLSFPTREDNIPWNSNIIVDRVSNSVLKTVSGRVYILVGKMIFDVDSGKPDFVWVRVS